MKNRAKCKLCQSIIESFHDTDYVICKCGQITVSGGLRMECSSLDWSNFLRVDDQGNEIMVKVVNSLPESSSNIATNDGIPSREDKIKILDEMIKTYENLPTNALQSPITGYDFTSALLVISSILKA